MKILIISEFFPKSDNAEISGGVETRAFYIAKELAKKHKVSVICSRENGTKDKDRFSGISVIRCGKEREYVQSGSILERYSFMRDAYKEGKKIDADIVDGYNFISYPPAYWIARAKKIPCVATYHDVWLNEWVKNIGYSGIAMEVLERYVLSRKWSRFISNSNYTKKKLIRAGIDEEKIDVVYSGVDLKLYEKIKAEKEPHPTICCISRLVKYKSVDDLIRAVAIIKKDILGIRCKIIGDGPERLSLQNLTQELGLQSNVEFLGYKAHGDALKILKSSHLFSLPSIVEGMGLVTVEAMACGIPYVNSRIPAQVEITENGKGGLLFEPKDPSDLAAKAIILLENSFEHQLKVTEGLSISKGFDWKILSKKIIKIYEKC